VDIRLLEKFYRGECSPEEVAKIWDWFKEEELNPQQEQELERLWQQAAEEKQHHECGPEAERILAGINQAIDSQERTSRAAAKGPALKAGRWIFQAAAALALLAGFLWLFTAYFAAEQEAASRLVTRQTPPGTRQTIKLDDGSTITLNAGSRISFLQPFPAQKREITLLGEAFFQVAKDSRRPFIVTTGQLKTRALGTSFNIRYATGRQTAIFPWPWRQEP
jgi:transmembrane sensor